MTKFKRLHLPESTHSLASPRFALASQAPTTLAKGGCAALLAGMVALSPAFVQGQIQSRTAITAAAYAELPDAPSANNPKDDANGQSSASVGNSVLSGVVVDSTGAAVGDVVLTLLDSVGKAQQKVTSGSHGEFAFAHLGAGRYMIAVASQGGFQSYKSDYLALSAGQALEIPAVTLIVAGSQSEITVRPTDVIAAEQIKAEEKQRLIGVFPTTTSALLTMQHR